MTNTEKATGQIPAIFENDISRLMHRFYNKHYGKPCTSKILHSLERSIRRKFKKHIKSGLLCKSNKVKDICCIFERGALKINMKSQIKKHVGDFAKCSLSGIIKN